MKREGAWIHEQLNPKKKKAKEAPDTDAPEDQPDAPKKEATSAMLTRYTKKRGTPDGDNLIQTTISLEPQTKRQKTDKAGKQASSPAKTLIQEIDEIQGKKVLTKEQAFQELELTNENLRLQILTVNQLNKRREELMAIGKPVIEDPMDAFK